MKYLHITSNTLHAQLAEIENHISSLDSQLQFKAMLIFEEVLTNQIRHANFEGRTPEIKVLIDTTEEKKTQFLFRDNAKEFNLVKYPDPDINADIDDREPGGLGIYLSKKYAKELCYSYDNGCNTLKIIL